MNDDVLYEEVAKEIQSKAMVPGLWARAFAEAQGSLDHARALYIRYRVSQLAAARNARLEQERRRVAEVASARNAQVEQQRRSASAAARRRALVVLRRLIFGGLVFVWSALTIICGLSSLMLFSSQITAGGVFMILPTIAFGVLTHKSYKATQG